MAAPTDINALVQFRFGKSFPKSRSTMRFLRNQMMEGQRCGSFAQNAFTVFQSGHAAIIQKTTCQVVNVRGAEARAGLRLSVG